MTAARPEIPTGWRILELSPREAWRAHRTTEVEITGLAECLPDFGLTT